MSTRPLVLGMAGGSASGKSVLSDRVRAKLGDRCLHLAHDRYYRTLDGHFDPHHYNFDHPDSLETDLLVEHLDLLLAGSEVELPRYDFATHSREEQTDRAEPRPIILLEGILVLAESALRERMDVAVYVHAPDAVRLTRRVRRDVTERGRPEDEIRAQFALTVRPMHEKFVEPSRALADLVLDGTASLSGNAAVVLAALEKCGLE